MGFPGRGKSYGSGQNPRGKAEARKFMVCGKRGCFAWRSLDRKSSLTLEGPGLNRLRKNPDFSEMGR